MERKKRSKGRGWESCYVKKIYGTFGVEMRSYGQKLVKLCTHTHTHTRVSYRPVKLWFDPKQIATETISPVLIQEISPEHHIKNII